MAREVGVTLPQDLPGRGNVKAGQSAVRLSEVRQKKGKGVHSENLSGGHNRCPPK